MCFHGVFFAIFQNFLLIRRQPIASKEAITMLTKWRFSIASDTIKFMDPSLMKIKHRQRQFVRVNFYLIIEFRMIFCVLDTTDTSNFGMILMLSPAIKKHALSFSCLRVISLKLSRQISFRPVIELRSFIFPRFYRQF